jgi:very-short-patch-repair endonuclease
VHQSARRDSQGRRRYLDVELRTRRGRRLAVEVDGAAHLIVGSYWQDMARANEIVLSGQSLLRFPTVALYLDEATVVDQIRRAIND